MRAEAEQTDDVSINGETTLVSSVVYSISLVSSAVFRKLRLVVAEEKLR